MVGGTVTVRTEVANAPVLESSEKTSEGTPLWGSGLHGYRPPAAWGAKQDGPMVARCHQETQWRKTSLASMA